MPDLSAFIAKLGTHFGVLAESSTQQLTVICRDTDIAVGDMFLLPCHRGPERFYVFRTTQYANILNREFQMNDIARNKLTMDDSYFSRDLADEKLIELKGIILGYSQRDEDTDTWTFYRPRRLPEHLSDVYHVDAGKPEVAEVVRVLLSSQLGTPGLHVGELLAGESSLASVGIYLPAFALSHHIGVFGRTGCGKSNLMMVFLKAILDHNERVCDQNLSEPKASIFAIDPHNEFWTWHSESGGADGIRGIVEGYGTDKQASLVEPFAYLTAKNVSVPLQHQLVLSRADVTPPDLASIMEFSEQQVGYCSHVFHTSGERWIQSVIMANAESGDDEDAAGSYLPGTISAVQRRLGFLQYGHTRIFTRFDPGAGLNYDSMLPDIICALEHGRVLILDTTLMSELEQFLVSTVVARVLFSLRKALRSAESVATLEQEIRLALSNDVSNGKVGMRSLADALIERLESGQLPYIQGDDLVSSADLPYVNVVIEEAPSILNPDRMRFGSVFRDISRQGRKFGIGLTVVSQQVSEIDQGVLTQINTELTMALGNEMERREAVKNASADLYGFERELQVMGKGQVMLTASYRDVPLPMQVPNYDELERVFDGLG
jgi:uncharacterized protein